MHYINIANTPNSPDITKGTTAFGQILKGSLVIMFSGVLLSRLLGDGTKISWSACSPVQRVMELVLIPYDSDHTKVAMYLD